jgi:hypothetical protein
MNRVQTCGAGFLPDLKDFVFGFAPQIPLKAGCKPALQLFCPAPRPLQNFRLTSHGVSVLSHDAQSI